ncbi:hypothetical protein F4778DRAFT_25531 [Xylariomycetidae sp. FL2044]|nr:hypothetical protein F4778DRAFT_25531 [Xylariomycetidae sp. FL2044]
MDDENLTPEEAYLRAIAPPTRGGSRQLCSVCLHRRPGTEFLHGVVLDGGVVPCFACVRRLERQEKEKQEKEKEEEEGGVKGKEKETGDEVGDEEMGDKKVLDKGKGKEKEKEEKEKVKREDKGKAKEKEKIEIKEKGKMEKEKKGTPVLKKKHRVREAKSTAAPVVKAKGQPLDAVLKYAWWVPWVLALGIGVGVVVKLWSSRGGDVGGGDVVADGVTGGNGTDGGYNAYGGQADIVDVGGDGGGNGTFWGRFGFGPVWFGAGFLAGRVRF